MEQSECLIIKNDKLYALNGIHLISSDTDPKSVKFYDIMCAKKAGMEQKSTMIISQDGFVTAIPTKLMFLQHSL